MPKRQTINLGQQGCLCWETSTYSVECCDPDDRYAEKIGATISEPIAPEPEEEPES